MRFNYALLLIESGSSFYIFSPLNLTILVRARHVARSRHHYNDFHNVEACRHFIAHKHGHASIAKLQAKTGVCMYEKDPEIDR